MSFFEAKHIIAGYGRTMIVSDVSFSMESGCLTGVIGANGSGKTTLLKALCGILPHAGECVLDGTVLEQLSARQMARLCSYIPQRSGVSIDISVLDVVLMGFNPQLPLLSHPTAAMRAQAQEALAQVGLHEKADVNYLHLSEGQKQLCILARTLVSESRLLLLDEPESALDFRFRYSMLDLLRRWTADKQRSAIVTLHDPSLALNCCDQLLLLENGAISHILHPSADSLERMEEALSRIYGSVSLHRLSSRSGRAQLVMLKEEDA